MLKEAFERVLRSAEGRRQVLCFRAVEENNPDLQLLLAVFTLRWPRIWAGKRVDFEGDPALFTRLPKHARRYAQAYHAVILDLRDCFFIPALVQAAIELLEEENVD
jgi:hypothetical protein